MMNYKSVGEMTNLLRRKSYLLDRDIDLVVGIPRSGIIPGVYIALGLNVNFCDLQSFLKNTKLTHGQTRSARFEHLIYPQNANHVLLVDDSIATGKTFKKVRKQIDEIKFSGKVTVAAIYGSNKKVNKDIDICFESVKHPRLFEWNLLHSKQLEYCCFDIDGVLCLDPTNKENDDGENYIKFLMSAPLLASPSYIIGDLVTSRLEKYRKITEEWLFRNNVTYKNLHMLDLNTAEERRKLRIHASFKASIYRSIPLSRLFVESNPGQSQEIANLSGKHVLCYSNQKLYFPEASIAKFQHNGANLYRKLVNIVRRDTR